MRRPAPGVDAEERAWSAPAGVDWDWFDKGARLASSGERRPLIVPFLEAPTLAGEADGTWLHLALPRGSYATSVLEAIGVALPPEREGTNEPG